MNFEFLVMNQKEALEIANNWHYETPYDFYDFKNDPEDYEELIDETKRQNYFSVYHEGKLFAFFVYEWVNSDVSIGLGIHPNFVSKGYGSHFINACLNFLNQDDKDITLAVAIFNKRAQKLYEKCGFVYEETYMQATNQSHYEFIKMRKKAEMK